jgi:two-component system chemotaxis response regulator CheY
MRTLIAEDELSSRQILTAMLAEHGNCDVAVNGLEAIQACGIALERGAPYDLVLMDIMMPYLSGLEALERIRQMERERGVPAREAMKVIMITSINDPKAAAQAFFRGDALSYLVKPVDKGLLLQEIRKLRLID